MKQREFDCLIAIDYRGDGHIVELPEEEKVNLDGTACEDNSFRNLEALKLAPGLYKCHVAFYFSQGYSEGYPCASENDYWYEVLATLTSGTPAEQFPGRTWKDTDGTVYCNECCSGDRCDDPTHRGRKNCPYCKGTGKPIAADPLTSGQQAKVCTCPKTAWVGSEPNDSTCELSEEEHQQLAATGPAQSQPHVHQPRYYTDAGNTYCDTCHAWLHAGPPSPSSGAAQRAAEKGQCMSNRTLVELNHDYCPHSADEIAKWGERVALYMSSGDKSFLPDGVTWKHMRHHSESDPMTVLPELVAMLREAKLQIQYLHEKFQETSSGNGVIGKIDHVLKKADAL